MIVSVHLTFQSALPAPHRSFPVLTAADGKAPIATVEEEDDDVPGECLNVSFCKHSTLFHLFKIKDYFNMSQVKVGRQIPLQSYLEILLHTCPLSGKVFVFFCLSVE